MAVAAAMKKQICSEKYEGSAPNVISAMAAGTALLKHYG